MLIQTRRITKGEVSITDNLKTKRECEQQMKPLVSIIIPNWNGRDILSDCLTSLNQLTYPNYEIIVVDNGSTDGSGQMVKNQFPEVNLIASPDNLGFACGCNLGIKASKGAVIALFNNDATAEPLWLEKLVDLLEQEPKIGICSGVILYDEPRDIVWSAGSRIDAITGMDWRFGHGQKLNGAEEIRDIDYIPGCAFLFPRSILTKIGLLNENYFFYGEDLDWTFCLKRLGYELRVDSSALVWHKASFSRRKNPLQGYYQQMKGLFRIYLKHFPLKYLISTLCFQLFAVPVFETLLFKTSPLYFLQRVKAFAWNMIHLRKTVYERRQVNLMGKLELKNRFMELLNMAKKSVSSKDFDF